MDKTFLTDFKGTAYCLYLAIFLNYLSLSISIFVVYFLNNKMHSFLSFHLCFASRFIFDSRYGISSNISQKHSTFLHQKSKCSRTENTSLQQRRKALGEYICLFDEFHSWIWELNCKGFSRRLC